MCLHYCAHQNAGAVKSCSLLNSESDQTRKRVLTRSILLSRSEQEASKRKGLLHPRLNLLGYINAEDACQFHCQVNLFKHRA